MGGHCSSAFSDCKHGPKSSVRGAALGTTRTRGSVVWHGFEPSVDAKRTFAWSMTMETSGLEDAIFGNKPDIISWVICLEDQQTVKKLIIKAAQGARTFQLGLSNPVPEISDTTPHCITAFKHLNPPVETIL
jgi:hypothetical protein